MFCKVFVISGKYFDICCATRSNNTRLLARKSVHFIVVESRTPLALSTLGGDEVSAGDTHQALNHTCGLAAIRAFERSVLGVVTEPAPRGLNRTAMAWTDLIPCQDLPHVILLELRQALISYQGNPMSLS